MYQETARNNPQVQMIVKDDRGKAIAWLSVSCKTTCYLLSNEETVEILSLHFAPSLQSAVCILYRQIIFS